ncbi:MAG: BamA/TamA family outer membrane protein, partial [Acidobacteria bacterium]|nr:BamA/TamA family outer membrane protein [Acidobacteriota bacterium]
MMLHHFLRIGAIVFLAAHSAFGQTPVTRQQALQREREAKSTQLQPYAAGWLERLLFTLENDRLVDRVLNPEEGLYARVGTITPGSGLSLGPAYRKPDLLSGHAQFSASAQGSFTKYWSAESRLAMPRIGGTAVFVEMYGQTFEFPEEDFFGLGAESQRQNRSIFALRNTIGGVAGGVRPSRWLSVGGRVEHLAPRIGRGTASESPAIQTQFGEGQAPGLGQQPNFVRYEIFADLNYGNPAGNPRRGGRYLVGYQFFDDRDLNRFGFRRLDVDLRQYISLLRERRILALRAVASLSETDEGQEIPFYFQRTLGGPDDLRGFRRYRFRDRNLVLLQAEYRWEVFTAMDAAVFYDAGKVAAWRGELDLS